MNMGIVGTAVFHFSQYLAFALIAIYLCKKGLV